MKFLVILITVALVICVIFLMITSKQRISGYVKDPVLYSEHFAFAHSSTYITRFTLTTEDGGARGFWIYGSPNLHFFYSKVEISYQPYNPINILQVIERSNITTEVNNGEVTSVLKTTSWWPAVSYKILDIKPPK